MPKEISFTHALPPRPGRLLKKSHRKRCVSAFTCSHTREYALLVDPCDALSLSLFKQPAKAEFFDNLRRDNFNYYNKRREQSWQITQKEIAAATEQKRSSRSMKNWQKT